MTDEQLLPLSQTYSPAFDVLDFRLRPRVTRWLIRSGMSPERAEDPAQQTMVCLWKYAAKYDQSKGPVVALALWIARCRMSEYFRIEGRYVGLDEDEVGKIEDVSQQPSELAAAIEEALEEWRIKYGPDSLEVRAVIATLEQMAEMSGYEISWGIIVALLKLEFPDEGIYRARLVGIVLRFFKRVREIFLGGSGGSSGSDANT